MFSKRTSFSRSSNTETMVQRLKQLKLNSKGHPTVGHLSPKKTLKRQPPVNHYLERCSSLETTAKNFAQMIEVSNMIDEKNKKLASQMEVWCEEVYKKLYDFIDRSMEPSFDEIDAMLLVCRVLIENEMKYRLQEFILNCPKKFIITYSNNSERTPFVLRELSRMGLHNIRSYLISHVHETKLGTWNERRNTHLRGNDLLECTI